MNSSKRPLSPHIQIYDMKRFTSFMSVMHRATGIVISFGLGFVALWLACAASSESAFQSINRFVSFPLITFGLFILTGCLSYHFCTGIRHLLWDAGKTLSIPAARKTATYAQIGTVVLNLGLWLMIWSVS